MIFWALIFYKCRFGFANIDEGLYLATPYRFVQGSRIFVDEWNFSQFSAAILYPLVKIYMWIFKSTEGILLSFRYIFTALHGITAAWMYIKLRKYGLSAVVISVVYLLFVPFGIMAFSYNSMGVSLMAITCVLLYSNDNKRRAPWIISGVTFALAVLCCPYLFILYLIFAAACTAMRFARRKLPEFSSVLSLKNFGLFTAGCGISAVLFVSFVLFQSRPTDIFENLSLAFKYTNHLGETLLVVMARFVLGILKSNKVSLFIFPAAAILFAIILFDKGRKKREAVYFLLALTITALYLAAFILADALINCYMFPLVILGFFCFVLRPKELIKPFGYLWMPGMIYAFCLDYASDQQFLATADAALVSTLGSILLIFMFLKTSSAEHGSAIDLRLCRSAALLLLAGFVLSLSFVRYEKVFWEKDGLGDKTAAITVGSEKGILTTEETKEDYESLYAATEIIRNHGGKSVLYCSERSYLYLDDQKKNASFSSWMPQNDAISPVKLAKYYSVNYQNLPDIVCMEKRGTVLVREMYKYFENLGYQFNETPDIIYFIKTT